jgi:hypothetical protein
MNFLESLAAEWYGYSGYFIRTKVYVLHLKRGGYGAELDVLAFLPKDGQIVHIETSSDSLPWAEREKRMRKKFNIPRKAYEGALSMDIKKVKKVAICGSSFTDSGRRWDDIEVISIRSFIRTIYEALSQKDYMKQVVPESYPLLRAIQMTAWATKTPTYSV